MWRVWRVCAQWTTKMKMPILSIVIVRLHSTGHMTSTRDNFIFNAVASHWHESSSIVNLRRLVHFYLEWNDSDFNCKIFFHFSLNTHSQTHFHNTKSHFASEFDILPPNHTHIPTPRTSTWDQSIHPRFHRIHFARIDFVNISDLFLFFSFFFLINFNYFILANRLLWTRFSQLFNFICEYLIRLATERNVRRINAGIEWRIELNMNNVTFESLFDKE